MYRACAVPTLIEKKKVYRSSSTAVSPSSLCTNKYPTLPLWEATTKMKIHPAQELCGRSDPSCTKV